MTNAAAHHDALDLRTTAEMLARTAGDTKHAAAGALAGTLSQEGALAVLADLDHAAAVLRTATAAAVAVARGLGASWQAVGAELDISRQATQQRFGSQAE